jgi:phage/plasmid-like protein (TIGR03299 family)
MYDPFEKSGAPSAPGAAHRRIVWTGEPPWWIGRADYEPVSVHLDSIPDAATAFAAMGEYKLAKVPLYAFPTRDENGAPKRVKVRDLFGIARSDTKEMLPGVAVTEQYKIIQPVDSLEVLDAITKGHGAQYSTIIELADGKNLAATLKLDTSITVAGETIKPYLMFYTAHDGKTSAIIKNVTQRPECRNTMNLALREGSAHQSSMTHRGDIKEKLKLATRVMREALGYMTEFEKFANELARKPFTRDHYGMLVDKLFALPEDKGRAQTNAIRSRERFLETVLADNLNNIRGTAWGALNAVSDYNEHVRPIRNGTNDVDVKLERLFRRSFEDTTLVEKAQEIILELVR